MAVKHYLLASDFDQTLSFNDSGIVLSEMLGIADFEARVAGLSRLNLVQSGAELAYLIRHDPDFRRVRRSDLVEVGRRVRLKRNIGRLIDLLARGIDGVSFEFYVVSAAPEEVVHSALEGLVPPSHIRGTRFGYDADTGEINSIGHVTAGYGKVAALDALRAQLGIPGERTVYVGDGMSDVHAMLHVNRINGLTIAVSQARHIAQVARRTMLSDDALSVVIPILEEIAGYSTERIKVLFDLHGLVIQEWDKVRTDWLTIREVAASVPDSVAAA
ncbi:MAG TPA: HAD-IB family phosphatase [Gemmatimonadaceae bacterium]|nr:HAD-IB family phosphatase [Gemmatimonadaceae bacterium]